MSGDCEGCQSAHVKIGHLETRVESLETFKKWAKPILDDIKHLRNDARWMIFIATAFSAIVAWVYIYQVSPFFKQQSNDKIEIIKQQNKDKIEIIREINKIKE